MKDILNKIEALYNELKMREIALIAKEEGADVRKRTLDDQERRLTAIQNDVNARQRVLDKVAVDQATVNDAHERLKEAKKLEIKASEDMAKADAIIKANKAKADELEAMQKLYRDKTLVVEQRIKDIEERKKNLRVEVIKELSENLKKG